MAQHIMNIAFEFDDEHITEMVERRCEKELYGDIRERVMRKALKALGFSDGSGWKDNRRAANELLQPALDAFFEAHGDEIVDAAAERVAATYMRRKASREKLDGRIGAGS